MLQGRAACLVPKRQKIDKLASAYFMLKINFARLLQKPPKEAG